MSKYFLFIIIAIFSLNIHAIREAKPTAVDSRIRVMVYNPNDVFKFVGYYNYQASIELGKEEKIESISMGDTTGWQIVPSGNRIFIKPVEQDATTNMTLITNKRTYFFELYAAEAADIRDPDMAFNIKFIYPDEEASESIKSYSSNSSNDGPDLSKPENYNFKYLISGPERLSPNKIFDDGKFTYMEFKNLRAVAPAIFAVDENMKEYTINSHVSSDRKYFVIEGVYQRLAVRFDKSVVCVYNDGF